MQEAKSVAINVVTWNSMAYIPQLCTSLDEQTTSDFSLTIVDNASTDGITDWIQRERPETGMLRNFRNQGFARGHNQAIQLARARWEGADLAQRFVLVTNPDIEFAPNTIELLLQFMMQNPDVMACGPKLLQAKAIAGEDGSRETERTTIIDSTGIVIKKTRQHADRGAGEEDRGQYDAQTDVFGISGACFMIRASAFAELAQDGEVFDEDFFLYKEDVDVCWRMQRLGMRIRFIPEAIAWHHRRAPSGPQGWLWTRALVQRFKKPAHVNFYSTRNHLWLLLKNDEWGNLLLHAPWFVPYEFGKFLVGVIQPSAWRAMFQMMSGIPRMLKKRGQIASRVIVSGKAIRRYFV